MDEKGIKNIGHWSKQEEWWWEKTIYSRNILKVPVPSFTFSAESLESNQVFAKAQGILVICEGVTYPLQGALF